MISLAIVRIVIVFFHEHLQVVYC